MVFYSTDIERWSSVTALSFFDAVFRVLGPKQIAEEQVRKTLLDDDDDEDGKEEIRERERDEPERAVSMSLHTASATKELAAIPSNRELQS